jgi:hypothetical protein
VGRVVFHEKSARRKDGLPALAGKEIYWQGTQPLPAIATQHPQPTDFNLYLSPLRVSKSCELKTENIQTVSPLPANGSNWSDAFNWPFHNS